MLMEENKYSKKAGELFRQGYNCAQSVFCAFAEDIGMDIDTALKLSSSFGPFFRDRRILFYIKS